MAHLKNCRKISDTEYKHVSIYHRRVGKGMRVSAVLYVADVKIGYKNYVQPFYDIKEAAKYVDIKLIENGKDPLNILVKK